MSLSCVYDLVVSTVLAHSMGNLVVGEAIRGGLQLNHYAMLHAATSASCYSNQISSYIYTNQFSVPDTDTDPFTRNLGYTGYLGGITGGVVNFYDEIDSVITTDWDFNNSTFKPQVLLLGLSGGYAYNPDAISGQKLALITGLDQSRFVINASESKPYVDQSLTESIGSLPNLSGAIVAGVSEDVFGDDHSYEWDHGIQDINVAGFYVSLMGTQCFNIRIFFGP
jgi:hypothetical protein